MNATAAIVGGMAFDDMYNPDRTRVEVHDFVEVPEGRVAAVVALLHNPARGVVEYLDGYRDIFPIAKISIVVLSPEQLREYMETIDDDDTLDPRERINLVKGLKL